MLEVNIEKIIPVTEARDSLNNIIEVVENSDELYVITKNGKPAAIIVGVNHLEKLTGVDHKEIMPDEEFNQSAGSNTASVTAQQDDQAIIQDSTADQPTDPLSTPLPTQLPASDDDIFAPNATQDTESIQPVNPSFETSPINQVASSLPASTSAISTDDDIFGESFDDTTLAASTSSSPTTFNNASVPLDQVVPSAPVDGQFNVPATPDNTAASDSGVDDIFGSSDSPTAMPNTNQQSNSATNSTGSSQL